MSTSFRALRGLSFRVLVSVPIFISAWLLAALELGAQVLTVEPGCGKAGDTFNIGGSGWAEPNPVCEYIFYFSDNEFAARQPDGLFGPPNRNATVPAVAAGDHDVKVELRLTSDSSLLQCRQIKFRVVDAIKDPWDGGNNISLSKRMPASNPNTRIDIAFDSTDVCEPKDTTNVSSCTKIAIIQARKLSGFKAGSFVRFMTYQEQGCWSAAEARDKETVGYNSATMLIDASVANAGWKIDITRTSGTPYYQEPFLGNFGFSHQFKQTPSDKNSDLVDYPSRADVCYPADIDTMKYEFRANVFCAEGVDRGRYFGGVTWTWEREQFRKRPDGTTEHVGAIAHSAPDRNPPSAAFLAALNLWATANSKTIPVPGPPTKSQSMPCAGG